MLLAHAHSPYAWQADVDTTVVIPALSLLYLFAVGRVGAPRWRILCFAGSMALLAVAFWTPLHHLGLHYLLTAHLLQNVILAEWAPLLAVLGISAPMARFLARSSLWRLLTQPFVALPVWLVNYFAWHAPPLYQAALHHQSWLIHLEHDGDQQHDAEDAQDRARAELDHADGVHRRTASFRRRTV